MILDMIQGCRYLRRSTDRWLLSKNSTTRLDGLESWHGAGLLWNCAIPITNTKGYIYTLSLTWLLVDYDYNIDCLILTTCRHVGFVPIINSSLSLYLVHVIMYPQTFPPSIVEQLFAEWWRITDHRRLLPNALKATPAEWYSPANLGPHVSFLLYQFLVLTYAPSITG
jgi:hypothetical protein